MRDHAKALHGDPFGQERLLNLPSGGQAEMQRHTESAPQSPPGRWGRSNSGCAVRSDITADW